jgi:adenylate cyclase
MARSAMARLLLGGWGRRAAWAVLIVFLALQAGAGWLFDAPRIALFDSYQRTLPRTSLHKGVVIVAIDDTSLARIGQWPWPHHVIARLVSAITKGGPLALGIDMIWPEPDRQSPEQWLKDAGDVPPRPGDGLAAIAQPRRPAGAGAACRAHCHRHCWPVRQSIEGRQGRIGRDCPVGPGRANGRPA